jgi:murein L,D-transpeptidase YcbB/YkuD
MAAHISKALVSYTVKTIMKSYRRTFFSLILCLLSSVAIPSALAATAEETAGNQLCDRIEQIQQTQRLAIGEDAISSIHLITEFYDRRNYTLAWQSDRNMGELLAMIEASSEEGLLPTDYHQAALKSMLGVYRAGNMAPCDRADLDILLTDALLRLGYHYVFGKVNPRDLDAEWNLQRKIEGRDPVEVMQAAIDAVSLAAFLQKLAPTSPLYDEFKKALAEYRAIEARGGWPQVPPGPTLKPGMPDERIAVIRERLLVTGDLLDASSSNPTVYDEKLEEAVIHFQKRHVLDADGVVGKATLAAPHRPDPGQHGTGPLGIP